MAFLDWPVEIWTLIVGGLSLLALFRPEWSAFYRWYRSDLDLHPVGRIELGFAGFGSSLAFQGTLRAIHSEEFVSNINIHIEKSNDQNTHILHWLVFRSTAISIDFMSKQQQNIDVQVAAPFSISISEPKRFHIMFSNIKSIETLKNDAEYLKREWQNFVTRPETREYVKRLTEENIGSGRESVLFDEFCSHLQSNSDNIVVNLHSALERKIIWEPGEYTMKIIIETSRPNKIITYICSFSVSEKQFIRLKSNTIGILMDLCGFTSNFNHEHVEMRDFRRL